MFSALKNNAGRKMAAVVMMAGLSGIGCQRVDKYPVTTLSPAPLIEDEAMMIRDWPVTRAEYASGFVFAGPTLYPYETKWTAPSSESLVTAPLLFYGQSLLLPINFLVTPPGTKVYTRGVYTEPTYTAVPAAPDDAFWYK